MSHLTALDLCFAVGALERDLREEEQLLALMREQPANAGLIPDLEGRIALKRARVQRFNVAWDAACIAEARRLGCAA